LFLIAAERAFTPDAGEVCNVHAHAPLPPADGANRMKAAKTGTGSHSRGEKTKFFQVALFRSGEPTQIEFFESDELPEAKQSAIVAVRTGAADYAEVRDEVDKLTFRPFRTTP
jgi:hypothetical protein